MPSSPPGADKRTLNPETLEKLRRTILELFSEALFQDVGIRAICKQAKVSPQTVYKYFGNKEEMLYACIRQDMDRLNDTAFRATLKTRNAVEKNVRFLDAWCDFYFAHPSMARIVFLNIPQAYWVGDRQFIQLNVHKASRHTLQKGQDRGEVWDGASPDLMGQALMGMAHRLMVRWLLDDTVSAETTKATLIALTRKVLGSATEQGKDAKS